ncbi:hypothetical protein CK203_044823 [Vitis vinifera]|uniref:DUF4283 domain-containing protein n=1 Tax=Vitis vinifera TaxID=29760 RepID=A0A438H6R3_VITVI|nr:hypothetical protein CK203_044823 [Vitis vinifera]
MAGNGLFLLAMAKRREDLNFLGLEINEKLVRRCLDCVHQYGIMNGNGGERERERAGERVSESERFYVRAMVAKNIGGLEPRNSRWKSNFKVESKTFEIEAKRRRAKCKSLLWKGKEGCRGSGEEKVQHLYPQRKMRERGWVAMVETLRALGVAMERKESQKEKAMSLVPSLGKSFAEVVKMQNCNSRSVARVELVKGDDLRSRGNQMARSWVLNGNLGLAKLERGKVLMEFEMVAEAEKALNLGGIFGGEKCGGFLAIDYQTERLEELQWARILVKLTGEEIPSMIEIRVEGVCYSLILWWEVRPVMRVLPVERRGENSGGEEEVEGDASACAGKHVMEEVDNARIETHLQSVDGTRGQTGGSGLLGARFRGLFGSSELGVGPGGLDPVSSSKARLYPLEASSLEGSRRLKAVETIGAPGPAGRDDCRGPSQSLEKDGRQKQVEEELYSMERSRTYNTLIEEASRYGCAPIPSGLLTSGSSPSPSFFFGQTPLGEYCDLSGDDRVTHLREIPLRMLLTLGPLEEENANRWELMEGTLDAHGFAGGLLICWNKRTLEVIEMEVGNFSISCRLRNVEDGLVWMFTGGDFNVILSLRERSNQGRLTSAMRRFAQVVDELELIDLPLQGGVLTWSGGRNNQAWAKLDRFLVTQSWLDHFNEVVQSRLPRPTLDHFSIFLIGGLRRGPSPFRFENMWLKADGFTDLLRGWWQGVEMRGRASVEPGWRADIEGLHLKRLNSREAEVLEMPFTEEEIYAALMDMNGDKAPGPDGFTVAFWQSSWELVKEEIMDLFRIL